MSYGLKQSPIPFDFWKKGCTFRTEQSSSFVSDKPEHVLFLSQQCKFAAQQKLKRANAAFGLRFFGLTRKLKVCTNTTLTLGVSFFIHSNVSVTLFVIAFVQLVSPFQPSHKRKTCFPVCGTSKMPVGVEFVCNMLLFAIAQKESVMCLIAANEQIAQFHQTSENFLKTTMTMKIWKFLDLFAMSIFQLAANTKSCLMCLIQWDVLFVTPTISRVTMRPQTKKRRIFIFWMTSMTLSKCCSNLTFLLTFQTQTGNAVLVFKQQKGMFVKTSKPRLTTKKLGGKN